MQTLPRAIYVFYLWQRPDGGQACTSTLRFGEFLIFDANSPWCRRGIRRISSLSDSLLLQHFWKDETEEQLLRDAQDNMIVIRLANLQYVGSALPPCDLFACVHRFPAQGTHDTRITGCERETHPYSIVRLPSSGR